MQRRNVLLPEPDGPITHITSFGCTSRSMPCSTSSRPKLLCTASALTIGPMLTSGALRTNIEKHAPESLERRWGQLALRPPAEVALEVVLADGQDRRHDQVPDAYDDEKLDHVKVE